MPWTKFFILMLFPLLSPAQENFSTVTVQKNYDHPFFHTAEWSYPWFMIKEDDGSFQTTMSDSSGKDIMDTTHIMHQAKCYTNHPYEHTIRFCQALLKGDTLVIVLSDFTASTNDRLELKLVDGKFSSTYLTQYVFRYDPDDLSWPVKKQKLIVNHTGFKKGDMIKGHVDFTAVEKWKTSPDGNQTQDDFVHIEGPFSCIVE